MPDLDILGKNVSPYFASAYRLVCGGQEKAMVLAALRRGLALSLNRGGGIPGLRERAALLVSIAKGNSEQQAIVTSRRFLSEQAAGRNAQMAHRAVLRLIADGLRVTTQAEAEHVLAVRVQHELLENRLFSCLRFEASVSKKTAGEFTNYANQTLDDLLPAVASFATQIVQDPTGATVRTPPSPRRTRINTREILDQSV